MNTTENELAEEVAKFYDDPLGFVLFAFPWDTNPMIQQVPMPEEYQEKYGVVYGPDQWAINFLEKLQDRVRAANDPSSKENYPLQFSTASGHGIGKTTLVAWLILWIMSTRPYCKGIVTANTGEQLRSKTWSELSKWLGLCITKHWFSYNSGRGNMKIAHVDYPEEWNCQAQTNREEKSEAFAGLHAANSTPFYIFDEASAIPDKIFEVREGGTTDGEAMTFDFGNPTSNSGRFFENTEGMFSHRYITANIDSRDVAVTNKKRIAQWIEDYGVDSDYVKVRVRGEFPSVGERQYINSDDVKMAMELPLPDNSHAPLVIGVDVARFGLDDTVIYSRIGRDARSFPPTILSGADTVRVAGIIREILMEWKSLGRECYGLFIDNGGGGGVIDLLRAHGFSPIGIWAQKKPNHPDSYRYKTDEMWGEMRKAIQNGLCLPSRTTEIGRRLYSELTQREYGYTGSAQVQLESKEDMKKRGIKSPDIADALALTYAMEINPDVLRGRHLRFGTDRDLSRDIWNLPQGLPYEDTDTYLRRGYGIRGF